MPVLTPSEIAQELNKLDRVELIKLAAWHRVAINNSMSDRQIKDAIFKKIAHPKQWVIETRFGYFCKGENIGGYTFPDSVSWILENATKYSTETCARQEIKRNARFLTGLEPFVYQIG